jgi:DNA-binding protein YbaB
MALSQWASMPLSQLLAEVQSQQVELQSKQVELHSKQVELQSKQVEPQVTGRHALHRYQVELAADHSVAPELFQRILALLDAQRIKLHRTRFFGGQTIVLLFTSL